MIKRKNPASARSYPLQKLPEQMSGAQIELHTLRPDAWPLFSHLPRTDQGLVITCFMLPLVPHNGFTNRGAFLKVCDQLREEETKGLFHTKKPAARRIYAIYQPDANRFAGFLEASMPDATCNVLAIGYRVLPQYRRKGYAREAVKLLTDKVIADNIFPCICAETKTNDEASPGVLLQADFVRAGRGLCSTIDEPFLEVERFIKAPTIPERWPLPQAGPHPAL